MSIDRAVYTRRRYARGRACEKLIICNCRALDPAAQHGLLERSVNVSEALNGICNVL
jgi:hypothetical protein